MKTNTKYWKQALAGVLLFMVAGSSSAQISDNPLEVRKSWQQQMDKTIPVMKDQLTTQFNQGLWDFLNYNSRTGLTKEEWPTLNFWSIAHFRLEYSTFMALHTESKIEDLITLDTTHLTYLCFNEKEKTGVIKVSGTITDGVWKHSGFHTLHDFSDTAKQLFKKNNPLYELRIETGPDSPERTLLFYRENGQFVAFTSAGIRPLMEALMIYQENIRNHIVF